MRKASLTKRLLKDDDAFQFVSLQKKPYEILVELVPHPGHKHSEFTSRVGMVSFPFLFLVKGRIGFSLDVCREKSEHWRRNFPAKEIEEDAHRFIPWPLWRLWVQGKIGCC